jgi:hypothetical protein
MNNAGKAFTTRFIFIHKDLPVFTSYLSWHFLSPLLCFKEIYRFLQRGKERLRCYAYVEGVTVFLKSLVNTKLNGFHQIFSVLTQDQKKALDMGYVKTGAD